MLSSELLVCLLLVFEFHTKLFRLKMLLLPKNTFPHVSLSSQDITLGIRICYALWHRGTFIGTSCHGSYTVPQYVPVRDQNTHQISTLGNWAGYRIPFVASHKCYFCSPNNRYLNQNSLLSMPTDLIHINCFSFKFSQNFFRSGIVLKQQTQLMKRYF